jgi:hypothetical protein
VRFKVVSRNSGGTGENHENLRIVGGRAEIRPGCLQNRSKKRYPISQPFLKLSVSIRIKLIYRDEKKRILLFLILQSLVLSARYEQCSSCEARGG